MAQEIGESREAWGWDVWRMVEDFANNMKKEMKPYWIVYAAKEDRGMSNKLGRTAFKQDIKAYYDKPPVLMGILVWYVNNATSEFRFVPELSSPYDVPLDPNLLSGKASDASERVMQQGENLKALVS